MKKFTGILLSVAMIFSVGTTTVLAESDLNALSGMPEESDGDAIENETESVSQESLSEEIEDSKEITIEEEEKADIDLEEETDLGIDKEKAESEEPDDVEDEESVLVTLSSEAEVELIEYTGTLENLSYDDRYDLNELTFYDSDENPVYLSSGVEYVIYQTEFAENEGIKSYKVSEGKNTGEPDTDLLTQKEEGGTEVIATGVGTGTVWLVDKDKADALDEVLNEDEDSDQDESEEESDDNGADAIEVYKIKVTVEPARLTLMFLAGQSNMEGYCSDDNYIVSASIACEEGTVYSTYAPSSTSNGKNITGISSISGCTSGNAGDFVAGSLQEGTNMDGEILVYPIDSLTTAGGGKTGPDSALAYKWNQLTNDKVWVVNTAYGNSSIDSWIPSGSNYQRSDVIWDYVLQTFAAEEDAGHYTKGDRLAFWLQGETGDRTTSAEQYESYFANMYSSFEYKLSLTGFGIIMVRASTGSYTTDDEWEMTGPRIAQYWLGSGDSKNYSHVYVVTNANEQWVSDSKVKTYFKNAYPGGSLDYPMHNYSNSLPTTVSAVHSDIHYSQIGHNENGITAAEGMYKALYKSATPSSVSWRDANGQTVSSISLEYSGDEATLVAVPYPIYYAKSVTYSSGSTATYNASTGTVKGTNVGTSNISAIAGGSSVGTIEVKVNVEKDLSDKDKLGKVTGVYKYNGTWYYVVKGIIQTDYEGVQKNDNGWWYIKDGMVDFTYTGFAQNENGWWYIEDGKVTFEKNGVLKDINKKVDGTDGWWYVVESEVQFDYTNKVANYKNSNGWWYIKNGKVDFDANTIAKNNNGWWYVTGGKVDFSYNGFGSNSNGKWYCEDGKVTFNKNSVLKDTTGAIGTKGTWYYVVGSQVQTSYTGVANYKNSNGWWYVKDGRVDFDANTVAKNDNGWWYVLEGKVQFSFTGLANYSNTNGWWYIKEGKVDFNHSGVDKNVNGWWYVSGGKVNFSFNGIAQNSNGWWYIKNGKVDFSYTGKVMVSGITYTVTDGKVAR